MYCIISGRELAACHAEVPCILQKVTYSPVLVCLQTDVNKASYNRVCAHCARNFFLNDSCKLGTGCRVWQLLCLCEVSSNGDDGAQMRLVSGRQLYAFALAHRPSGLLGLFGSRDSASSRIDKAAARCAEGRTVAACAGLLETSCEKALNSWSSAGTTPCINNTNFLAGRGQLATPLGLGPTSENPARPCGPQLDAYATQPTWGSSTPAPRPLSELPGI